VEYFGKVAPNYFEESEKFPQKKTVTKRVKKAISYSKVSLPFPQKPLYDPINVYTNSFLTEFL
jgi:hypothetical protein